MPTPSAEAGKRQWIVLAMCVVSVASVWTAEVVTPSRLSIEGVIFLPVLAAGWLLARIQFLVVTIEAIGSRLTGLGLAGVDVERAAIQIAVIVVIAWATRTAALGVQRLRETDARLREQQARIDLMAQQERIGASLRRDGLMRLFSATVGLQAAMTLTEDVRLQRRIQSAIDQLDLMSMSVRSAFLDGIEQPEDAVEDGPHGGPEAPSVKEPTKPPSLTGGEPPGRSRPRGLHWPRRRPGSG